MKPSPGCYQAFHCVSMTRSKRSARAFTQLAYGSAPVASLLERAEAKQEGAKPYSRVQTSVVWPTKLMLSISQFPTARKT